MMASPLSPLRRVRWARVLGACTALALTGASWWAPPALQRLEFFRVQRVRFVGVRFAHPDTLVRLAGVTARSSVWDPTAPAVARLRAHTLLQHVAVRRELPGTLVFVVTERTPVALAMHERSIAAVDAAGTALPIDLTRTPVDAPLLSVPDRRTAGLLGALGDSLPTLVAALDHVTRDSLGALVFRFDSLVVRAWPDSPLRQFRLLETVVRDTRQRRLSVAYVDLRFPGSVVVRVRPSAGGPPIAPGTTPAPAPPTRLAVAPVTRPRLRR